METKLILADAPLESDETLIRNIARANTWIEGIKGGDSFADLDAMEDTSRRRIQQTIVLAFPAPVMIRDVINGRQPRRFTSDRCLRPRSPLGLDEQQRILAALQY